ncbi:hypothetical protein C0Q70_03809 [Pomacea canaliculata]|uniref:Chloride channel protein n=1 Tax=Pomacea canaliculata TaxID=400727 RepID=A0A2T7PTT1_POMCA|nr:hypothetical protein C0Q70_03809 [Pomacea canaliculata]
MSILVLFMGAESCMVYNEVCRLTLCGRKHVLVLAKATDRGQLHDSPLGLSVKGQSHRLRERRNLGVSTKDYESTVKLEAVKWGVTFLIGFLTAMPVAAGSGIPEIKCYLNGVRVPHVVRLRSLVAKAIGVLFSVAGGLFVGKEGSMIHSGSIIGAGVPQVCCVRVHFTRNTRDFVSGGAAAGVAAAFGAPIGGVLFSLEEGSSFWNQKLTWRTFFCSMAATFSLNFFLSGLDSNVWGYFYLPGLIDFGVFRCPGKSDGGCTLWGAFDLLIFILMGCVGGLLGALFNGINCRLASFGGASCLDGYHHRGATSGSPADDSVNGTVRTYFCQHGYYNDMATLFFNPQEVAIKQLFHQEGTFGIPSLGIFFLLFFLMSCWTYGLAVPSGLFVPALCGAAYGRLVANVLETPSLDKISHHYTAVGKSRWDDNDSRDCCRLKARDVLDTSRHLSVVFPKTRVASLVKILKTTAHRAFPVVSSTSSEDEVQRSECFENQRGNRPANESFNDCSEWNSSHDPREGQPGSPSYKFEGLVLRAHIAVLLKKQVWCVDGQQNNNTIFIKGLFSSLANVIYIYK